MSTSIGLIRTYANMVHFGHLTIQEVPDAYLERVQELLSTYGPDPIPDNYVHPVNHSPSIITQDPTNRFVTDVEKTAWNAKAPTTAVTTTENGLMIATDKTKLNGIDTEANNYTHPANHPPAIITQDASNRFVSDVEKAQWNAANNYVHPATHPPSIITQDGSNRFVTDTEKSTWNEKAPTTAVTTTENGLMIATDKVKLNGLNNYIHPTTAGNKHIPTGGAATQILKYSLSGTAVWGTVNGSEIVQSANYRLITDTERTNWNDKETTTGSQTKATQALTDSKAYTDTHTNNTTIHRNITIGTTDPTGGADGDVYFQYV